MARKKQIVFFSERCGNKFVGPCSSEQPEHYFKGGTQVTRVHGPWTRVVCGDPWTRGIEIDVRYC